MSKSLKQLVDARIKRAEDAARRIYMNESLGLTEEQQEAAFKKIDNDAHEELFKSIAACIIEATEKKDPTILHSLFGPAAYNDYCSSATIKELSESIKQDPHRLHHIYVYKTTNSFFLEFGFYYACYKGVLPLIRYYIEQQSFVEDMGNVTLNVRGLEKYFPNTPVLNGPPLKLATISNDTACVEYLYENTEAMAETECEGFSDKRSNLQIATANQNAALVRFLLSHAADPNAPIGANGNIMESLATFGHALFDLALGTRNIEIIAAYLEAGAMVDRSQVHAAIGARAPLSILQLLFARCINKEDLSRPYLLTAVATGDTEYLKLIESLPNVGSWQVIFAYHEDPLHSRLVHIATSSGSLAMLQHIAAQHHIDVKAIAVEDTATFETRVQSGDLERTDPINVSRIVGNNLIHKATGDLALLQFYLETLGLTLSEGALKLHCKASYHLPIISYFLSQIETDALTKEELSKIAIDFKTLPFAFLLRIFNTPLILEGNPFGDLYHSISNKNFIGLVTQAIQKATKDLEVVAIYREVSQDPAALKGALFYFCTELFAKDSQKFIDFFHLVRAGQAILNSQVISIDETNCLGTTLAHFAYQQKNHSVVDFLTSRGANPDRPNNKGETLLAERAHFWHSGKEENQKTIAYIEEHMREQQVGHSLLHKINKKHYNVEDIVLLLTASKGDIKPVSVDILIKAVLTSQERQYNREKHFTLLFAHLAEIHAIRLVQRLREPKTIEGTQAETLAKEFKYYLQQFEKTEDLAAEKKARRLSVPQPSLAPHAALFASSSVIGTRLPPEKVEEPTLSQSRRLNNSMD